MHCIVASDLISPNAGYYSAGLAQSVWGIPMSLRDGCGVTLAMMLVPPNMVFTKRVNIWSRSSDEDTINVLIFKLQVAWLCHRLSFA
jgi:hypothetical protein